MSVQEALDLVGQPVYFQINLDALTGNIAAIRKCCEKKNAGICAMVKGNGYGHGAVEVSHHLKAIGVERLGVATVDEGIQLRNAGIQGPIHLMGNRQYSDVNMCLRYDLIPTVTCARTIHAMAECLKENPSKLYTVDDTANCVIKQSPLSNIPPEGTVHIKIDSGMSRNGCQPEELPNLVQLCDELNVPLEGMYTHLADFENKAFTKQQMDAFYKAIEPYRKRSGLLFHASNSGGIMTGVGTELDMVRPGISIYGLPPGADIEDFEKKGFRPIGSVKGAATLVRQLQPGRKVGYGCTYEVKKPEWIATIPFGYADGYFRLLSNRGTVIRDSTGEKYAVVGRVSMDAITVRLPSPIKEDGEIYTLISDDFDEKTSATGIANQLETINYEVTTRISGRVPRLYCKGSEKYVERLAEPILKV